MQEGLYFEKVYSNKQYYGLKTHYEAIDGENVSYDYISKYYIYNENLGNVEYELASKDYYNPATTYYYKKNYELKEEGTDITNVFAKVTITLSNDGNNWILSSSAEDVDVLQNLIDTIDLDLTAKVLIVNNGTSNNDYYNVKYTVNLYA